jgi:hypothetical protein
MGARELVALLATVRVPAADPVEVGAKPTVSETLLPAATVTAPEKPASVKPAPEMAAWEMVTAPVPVFVRVTGCEEEVPTKVLGKLRLPALSESK